MRVRKIQVQKSSDAKHSGPRRHGAKCPDPKRPGAKCPGSECPGLIFFAAILGLDMIVALPRVSL